MFFPLFAVPTQTMDDTILAGDWICVRRLGTRAPNRGDIIVFRYPVDPKQTFLKRVVGLPRDRIRIVNKQLYVNGRELDEPYARHKSAYIDSYRDNFPSEPNVPVDPRATEMLRDHVTNGEILVPPNRYFVMGDNRDRSWDSRYWGFVSRDDIIGEPWIVYWSVAPIPDSGMQPGWASLRKIRWHRILTVIHSYPIH